MYIKMVKTLINTVGILSAVVDKKISYIIFIIVVKYGFIMRKTIKNGSRI